jgi:FixJ family two-component response regulator
VHDLPPISVVILDDDGAVRDATARLLQSWGLRHLELADARGIEARVADFLQADGAACVLIDQRLAGGETGIGVADRLRAAFGPGLGLILMTGETAPDVHAAARARGMIVLGKPLKPIRLRAALTAQAAAQTPASASRPA